MDQLKHGYIEFFVIATFIIKAIQSNVRFGSKAVIQTVHKLSEKIATFDLSNSGMLALDTSLSVTSLLPH